jgi:hypothetical protein
MVAIGKGIFRAAMVASLIFIAFYMMPSAFGAKLGVLDAVVSINSEDQPLGEVLAYARNAVVT